MSDPITVVVTESEYRKAEPVFAASRFRCVSVPGTEAELAQAIAEASARHAVVGHLRYEDALYRALAPGSVLARFGVGHDGIDKLKATLAGLLCTNTPGVLDDSVAELTMLLVSAAARHVTTLDAAMREGKWSPIVGTELRGKTLAVIGCGRIGTAVARIAARGYGMDVVGYGRASRRSADGDTDSPYRHVTADFREAVGDAHFVSLHIGATPENARFINAERLGLMRRDAWLINTARGAVVDEAALFLALAGRQIGGAALDVFVHEPYQPVEPARDLRTLQNVILTPHVGSNTPDANYRMAAAALLNIELAEDRNFEAMSLLNREVLAGRQ